MRAPFAWLIAVGVFSASAVTPVEKVVSLLTNLRGQLEKEAKAEAAQYDKYACFCKEQVDEKQYAIEMSVKKIEKFDATVNELDADISALNGEIRDLTLEISNLQTNITDLEKDRNGEHEKYLIDKRNVTLAISACDKAIKALKDSKKQLKGKAAKEALAQVQAIADEVLGVVSSKASPAKQQLHVLNSLAQEPGTTYSYSFKANDIIATLESLRKVFLENRNEIDMEEFELQAAFEKTKLGLQTEKKFAERERKEKQAQEAGNQEQLAQTKSSRQQEEKDKAADLEFRTVLTKDCEEKAELWDQRSEKRAEEITEMTKAMEALRTGVVPNWNANKKLAGLQRTSSFLQLRRRQHTVSGKEKALQHALKIIHEAAGRLASPVLTAVAARVQASEDHFVKVRQLIKDILSRLEDQKNAEATTKGFCDTEMEKAITSRDTSATLTEELEGQLSGAEANRARLKKEIASLQQAIADNRRALNEATQLRDQERQDNNRTVEDAGAGKEAVEYALNLLKNFYEQQGGETLLQRAAYVPPKSDRDGNTLEDVRPEIFDNEYKGAQSASTGIIGILEVILSDFDRTKDVVGQEEEDAQKKYEEFKTVTDADTDTKSQAITNKESEVSGLDDTIVSLTDNLNDAKESHKNALGEIDKLHSMCVEGEETYKERVEKRKKEIDALQEAYDILDNWSR